MLVNVPRNITGDIGEETKMAKETIEQEYAELVKNQPALDLTTKYKISGFTENGKNKLYAGFYRPHPMGGYAGGRSYSIGCSAYIQWMPRKKVYRAKWSEQDCGTTSRELEFETLAEAVAFVTPVFGGILGYFGDKYNV